MTNCKKKMQSKSANLLINQQKKTLKDFFQNFYTREAKWWQQIKFTTKHLMFSKKNYQSPENFTPSWMMWMVTFCKSGPLPLSRSGFPPRILKPIGMKSSVWRIISLIRKTKDTFFLKFFFRVKSDFFFFFSSAEKEIPVTYGIILVIYKKNFVATCPSHISRVVRKNLL